MARETPKLKVTRDPQTVTLLRQINTLSEAPKRGPKGPYWMVILDVNGVENMWFVNPPEKRQMEEQGLLENGSSFTVQYAPTGEYDDQNRAITFVKITGTGEAPAPAPRAPQQRQQRAAAPPPPPAQADGWVSSSFDVKLTPDLRNVHKMVDSGPATIYARLLNGVGDELADVARAKALKMVGLAPDANLTAAQATAFATAVQATFATLVISWKDLGYPVTPAERERIEDGGVDYE